LKDMRALSWGQGWGRCHDHSFVEVGWFVPRRGER